MNTLKMLGLSILAIFAPIKEMVATAIILILVDLVLGIWAAKKRGEKITSAAWRRTITKLLIYNLALLVGFMVQIYMINNMIPISNLIAGVIGLVEFKSILENSNDITGTNIFSQIVKKLGSENDTNPLDPKDQSNPQ